MKTLVASVILILGFINLSFSSTNPSKKNSIAKETVSFALRIQQGFNMRVWLSNQMAIGCQALDLNCGDTGPDGKIVFGLEYPAGSGIEHLYGAGPWIGGLIDGVRRVDEGYNGSDARKEILPELKHLPRERFWRTSTGPKGKTFDPLGYSGYYFNKGITVNQRGCDDDGDGKTDEDDLDGLDNDGDWNPTTDDVGADGLPDSLEVSCDGKPYSQTNLDPAGDNYDPAARDRCHPNPDGTLRFKNDPDIYTERNGIPDHGEPHVDEDYAAISDNDLYCSAIDTFRQPTVSNHVQMGIKVIQKSYAWDKNFAEGVLPFDYYFINVGRKTIRQVYVGFFADMDVGPANVPQYYANDFACYFDTLRTAYIHNAIDRGSTPLGITVLKTPRPLDSLKYIFQWFNGTGRPDPGVVDSNLYSLMSGEAYPNELIAPCQPSTNPSDTRFLFSFGPFETMSPGDTFRISIALVSGLGVAEGPNNLKENAEKALKLYNRGYVAPVIPPSPCLRATQGFKKVTLEWGRFPGCPDPRDTWDDSNKIAGALPDTDWRRINPPCGGVVGACTGHICDVNGKLSGGRIFEGYRLYRSEDPNDPPQATSFTLLRQFDLPGDPYEYNVGIDTVFVDTNLVRGKRYWYSVTSFGIPDIAIIPVKNADGSVRFDTLFTENSESSVRQNQVKVDLAFSASDNLGEVLVVPNPYRVDRDYTYENGGWEGLSRNWTENSRKIRFIHLPRKCTIRIFSLVGDQVATLEYDSHQLAVAGNDPQLENKGELDWDLLSDSHRALASGVYVFTVESEFGKQIGKFALIR
ncbi:MAG: hypothetical protein HYR76_10180 [Ignavibacteria bacterium]|nr:hypothetical protein [Ignavibacteria bacterium]